MVDSILAWSKGDAVNIRHPKATRPWQHVLEPLSGYLNLGMELEKNHKINGEAFNFGPKSEENTDVETLISDLSKYWSLGNQKCAYEVIEKE